MTAKYVQLLKGSGTHKYKMVFFDAIRKKIKSVSFGAVGYEDFITSGDLQKKQNYISRHKSNENWNDYMSAGALSFHLLWSKPTLSSAYKAYRKRFKLELY